MIKFHLLSLITGALILSSAQAANIPLAPKVEYSADQFMETEDTTITGKIYITPTKERREMSVSGENMITILRKDKKVAWTLMPAEQMYMEMAFDKALAEQYDNPANYKIETTPMGNEVVNGMQTDKTKVIVTAKDGTKMGGFWWVTKDGIVMKMDMLSKEGQDKMRVKMELKNVKIGKQNATMFEVPAGYSKMNMPSMGNIQDMMRAAEQESANDEEAPKNKGGFNFNDALKMIR